MRIPESCRDGLPSPEKFTKPDISFGLLSGNYKLTNKEIADWKVPTKSGTLTADGLRHLLWIDHRYVADKDQDVVSMAIAASKEALGGWHGGDIDTIIVSTSYPTGKDLSLQIQEGLGISCSQRKIIHAGCSGSGLGFDFLRQNFEFQGNTLFVATEKHSPYLQDLKDNVNSDGSLKDPALSQTIFSDGATACVFKYGKGIKMINSLVHKFPQEYSDLIKIPYDKRLLAGPFLEIAGPASTSGIIEQKGSGVLGLLSKAIPGLVDQVLSTAGLSLSDIDLIIPHQGSGKIVGAFALALNTYVDPPPPLELGYNSNKKYIDLKNINPNIPPVFNGVKDGNFSSGSGIKAEIEAIQAGKIKKGSKVLHIDFGWGLTAVLGIKEFG